MMISSLFSKKCQNIYCNNKGEYKIGLTGRFCKEHYRFATRLYISEWKKYHAEEDKLEEEL